LPNNFKEVNYCFSPGVVVTANFENELSQKFNIKSYMADASIKNHPSKIISLLSSLSFSEAYQKVILLPYWIG
jgi:hypothetical protein